MNIQEAYDNGVRIFGEPTPNAYYIEPAAHKACLLGIIAIGFDTHLAFTEYTNSAKVFEAINIGCDIQSSAAHATLWRDVVRLTGEVVTVEHAYDYGIYTVPELLTMLQANVDKYKVKHEDS